MSDPENFLARWARRKREAAEPAPDAQAPDVTPRKDEASAEATQAEPAPTQQPAEPLVDLTKLPSLDQITAETDISAFLVPGVPAELRLAALRRAWVSDPKIRDFVGLNDYDFDFHTPGAIPGFGPLEMTDDLRREVAHILRNALAEQPPADKNGPAAEVGEPLMQPAEALAGVNAPPGPAPVFTGPLTAPNPEESLQPQEVRASNVAMVQSNKESAAPQRNIDAQENQQSPAKRSHGGALPK